ncbi:MAG TPA: hypothetical protein VH142_03850 [Polyangiaceae bacterium]|jgi:hypothetical protein|nr:hypothetical protein [Polyangiaceae bacterium]
MSLFSRFGMVAFAVVFVARGAHAVPRSGTVDASSAPRCAVTLEELSYDTPGADDAEFIELRVVRTAASVDAADSATPSPPTVPPTKKGTMDASVASSGDASSGIEEHALTLGDCGLGAIRLVNGGGGACETYRTLPLADVAVPSDGDVVVCAADSTFAAHGACDVTSAGASTLKNGWLQNGPADGLEMLGTSGATLAEFAYEGAPSCFGANTTELVAETGDVAGDGGVVFDDVNVLCGGRYVLRSSEVAAPRAPDPCFVSPAVAQTEAGVATTATPESSHDAAAPWNPELAPGPSLPDAGFVFPPFSFDAGVTERSNASRAPSSLGCAVVAPGRAHHGGSTNGTMSAASGAGTLALVGCVVGLAAMRRRTAARARRRRPLRARGGARARSARSLPRSP